jgi:phage protein D
MSNRDNFDTLAPELRIEVEGNNVTDQLRADLVAVRVLEDIHATGMFAVTVTCWDTAAMKEKWIDDDLFKEGNTITVQMGYRDQMAKLFMGEINGLEPEFNTATAPTLTVRGYDRGHRLMRRRKTKSYLQMKDSDIAGQIASETGLTPEVQDTKVTLEYVLQHNQTDLEFLRDRAERIGYEAFVVDNKLYFRPRQTAGSDALTLKREVELLEFYPRSTTLNQVEQVAVQGWNPKQKKELVGRSRAADVRGNMGANNGPTVTQRAFDGTISVAVRSPVFSQEEADALATGMLNEMALTYVTGEGVCIGRTDLRPGKLIKIEGIGRRFSGSYYVTSTEHSYMPSRGYRTAFTVRRNAIG